MAGTEDEAIAALLHDAIEDADRKDVGTEIGQLFGERVRTIVEDVSERTPDLTMATDEN